MINRMYLKIINYSFKSYVSAKNKSYKTKCHEEDISEDPQFLDQAWIALVIWGELLKKWREDQSQGRGAKGTNEGDEEG